MGTWCALIRAITSIMEFAIIRVLMQHITIRIVVDVLAQAGIQVTTPIMMIHVAHLTIQHVEIEQDLGEPVQ